MDADLQTLPTADLIRAVRRNRLEQAIARSARRIGVALTLVLCIALIYFSTIPLFIRIVLGLFGSALLFWFAYSVTNLLADFRLRRHIWELNWRFGRLPVRKYLRHYDRVAPTPAMICLFHGKGLPYGNEVWASLWFGGSGAPALVRVSKRELFFRTNPNPWEEFEYREFEAPTKEVAQVRSSLNATRGLGDVDIDGHMIFDGYPVTLTVLFRDRSRPTRISANLCGLLEEQEQDEHVRLLRSVASMIGAENEATGAAIAIRVQ